jgi:hypothetical protein
MALPEVRIAMERSFLELDARGAVAFREKIRQETETWGKVIRERKITAE